MTDWWQCVGSCTGKSSKIMLLFICSITRSTNEDDWKLDHFIRCSSIPDHKEFETWPFQKCILHTTKVGAISRNLIYDRSFLRRSCKTLKNQASPTNRDWWQLKNHELFQTNCCWIYNDSYLWTRQLSHNTLFLEFLALFCRLDPLLGLSSKNFINSHIKFISPKRHN